METILKRRNRSDYFLQGITLNQ